MQLGSLRNIIAGLLLLFYFGKILTDMCFLQQGVCNLFISFKCDICVCWFTNIRIPLILPFFTGGRDLKGTKNNPKVGNYILQVIFSYQRLFASPVNQSF